MRYFTGTANATAANTASETSVLPSGVGIPILPAFILSPGREFLISACGVYSCTALAPTVTVKFKLGSTVIAQAAVASLAAIATNLFWQAKLTAVARTVNTGNTACAILALGLVEFVTGAGATAVTSLVNPSGAMTTATIDNSSDLALSVTDTWNVASASNSATVAIVGLDIN